MNVPLKRETCMHVRLTRVKIEGGGVGGWVGAEGGRGGGAKWSGGEGWGSEDILDFGASGRARYGIVRVATPKASQNVQHVQNVQRASYTSTGASATRSRW